MKALTKKLLSRRYLFLGLAFLLITLTVKGLHSKISSYPATTKVFWVIALADCPEAGPLTVQGMNGEVVEKSWSIEYLKDDLCYHTIKHYLPQAVKDTQKATGMVCTGAKEMKMGDSEDRPNLYFALIHCRLEP